ncbi:Abietadienol/abietadienal oxidase [Nymphaea thermarum]|nr:Abietadienol/abietadienal oxidase [Nymphaea thermarum]
MAFSFLAFESILVLFLVFLVFLIALLKLSARDATELPPGRRVACREGKYWLLVSPSAWCSPIFSAKDLKNEGRLFTAKYPKGLSVIIGKYGMLSIIDDLHRKPYGIAVRLLSMDKLKAHFLEELDSMIRSRVNQWIGNDILLQDECRKRLTAFSFTANCTCHNMHAVARTRLHHHGLWRPGVVIGVDLSQVTDINVRTPENGEMKSPVVIRAFPVLLVWQARGQLIDNQDIVQFTCIVKEIWQQIERRILVVITVVGTNIQAMNPFHFNALKVDN